MATGGQLLTAPCVSQANAQAAGLCLDWEVTCWDDGVNPDAQILFGQVTFDCDPASATPGAVLNREYIDPVTLLVVDPVALGWTPTVCAGLAANLDVELKQVCDRVIASAGVGANPDLITLTQFWQITVYDGTGAVAAGPFARDSIGGTYVPVGAVVPSPEIEQRVTPLCEYDALTQVRIGEFDRITYNEAPTGHIVLNQLGLPFYDVDIQDPSVAYILAPGAITRDCQNEVDCNNDPCIPLQLSSVPLPANGGNTAFSSFQLDPPLTDPGVRWKIDFFEQPIDPLVLAQLTAWMQSGPGGVLPPPDEIFVWRGLQGGPAAFFPGNPPTPLWAGTPFDLIIPGWMVTDYIIAGGGAFVNIWVDLTLTSPQICDLSQDLDPINFPGISVQAMINTADSYFADAIANLASPSAPFAVANNATPQADIYQFTAGNPIQSDSVVLCQTVVQSSVCFSGETEPLVQVSGINPSGQTVFTLFKRVLNGAIVAAPQGEPIDCVRAALAPFEEFCGDCADTFVSNVINDGATFLMSAIDAAPATGYAHRIQDNGTGMSVTICNFFNTADLRDILRIPVSGNGFLGVNTMVIPRWMMTFVDCSVPGEVFFSIDITVPHPDGCPDAFTNVPGLFQYIGVPPGAFQSFTRFFNNTTTGTFAPINRNGQTTITNFSPIDGGRSLRVIDCCTDAEIIELCDVQAAGLTVPFLRNIAHLCNGALTPESDYTLDGLPFIPIGTVSTCPAATLTTCEVEDCLGATPTPTAVYLPASALNVLTQPNLAAPYPVTIVYSSNVALADDLEACVTAGGYFTASFFTSFFGLVQFVFGGPGLTNLTNLGGGVISFDYDPDVSLIDLQQTCPNAVPDLNTGFQNSIGLLPIIPGLGGSMGIGVGPARARCFTLDFGTIDVPSQRVSVCGPVDAGVPLTSCGPCEVTAAIVANPLPAPNADDFTLDLHITSDVYTWTLADGAVPTGAVTALTTWITAATVGDFFVWDSATWGPITDNFFIDFAQVVSFSVGAGTVTVTQDFSRASCDLAQAFIPTPPSPVPGVPLSLVNSNWRQALDLVEVAFGLGSTQPIQDIGGLGIINGTLVASGPDAIRTSLCNVNELATAIGNAVPAPNAPVNRRGRVLDVTNGTIDPTLLDALSWEFVVRSGTVIYDGQTFTVGQGAAFGDDSNETPTAGFGVIDASTAADAFRISYTEIF